MSCFDFVNLLLFFLSFKLILSTPFRLYSLTRTCIDIPQWSVLAVRNLCERNPSNQRVIANLEQQVQVDTRKLLEDFGCEVEVGNDGKMKVKGAVKK